MRKMGITFFGLGYMPFASGSWGSLGAAVVYTLVWFVMIPTAGVPGWGLDVALLLGVAVTTALCIYWGKWACEYFGRSDPSEFVLDEVAGQWIALLLFPVSGFKGMMIVLAMQFFLFRLLDVIKPPPARQFERFPYGYGVVADDLMAGVYANIAGQVIYRFFLQSFLQG